ncbi:MAG: hypothetical protein ACK5JT_03230 [Hyphomicrobiaceae bacterium]
MGWVGDILGGTPLLPLLMRMVLVATFVVSVALIAERLGPFFGGMVASLPLLTGPVYVLLAFEHDAAYFAQTTVASVAICAGIPVFVLVYALLARSRSGPLSVLGALLAWSVVGLIVQAREWTLPEALLFVAPVYVVSLPLAQTFTRGVPIRNARRRWHDLLLRAMFVAIFTGIVVVVSQHVPPSVTGVLSVMPILMSSLILVLHPRIGGPGTAALMAHTLGGIVGMVLAFCAVNLTVLRIGVWPALALGLGISVSWNTMLIVARRLRIR